MSSAVPLVRHPARISSHGSQGVQRRVADILDVGLTALDSPGCGVVGVVAVPVRTRLPAQHQTMNPAVPVDHGQRVVQMPAVHWSLSHDLNAAYRGGHHTMCYGSSSALGSGLFLNLRPWLDDSSPSVVIAARVSWRRWWS
jgi:hypothetical protein